MTTDLFYLTCVTILTGLMWAPYILNLIIIRGLLDAVGYPRDPKPIAPWAKRLQNAHSNAVENLVIFAPLVIVAHLTEASNEVTALACMVYFLARVVHAVVYAFGLPWIRTMAFMVGVVAQMTIAVQILT